MKKLLAMILALVMIFALAACGKTAAPAAAPAASEAPAEAAAPAEEAPAEEAPEEIIEEAEPVMTHEEFMMADMDSEVVVEGYISAVQQFSEEYGNTSFFMQADDGAYFVYRIPCTAEDYEAFQVGQKIRITGFKTEWAGEVEIADASFQLIGDEKEYAAADVTDLLGDDHLIHAMNLKVSFKGLQVKAANDEGAAFLYNWDGSGEDGNDLYFNVALNGEPYTFTVESDLCPAGSDVYEAVKALNVGDRIKIRLTIETSRDLDFVQVTDRRAACMEPVKQLSGYQRGAYVSPKDFATNYYYYGLAKGKHVIETEYYIDRAGQYETGTCTVQCAYAPEYRATTPSITLNVK